MLTLLDKRESRWGGTVITLEVGSHTPHPHTHLTLTPCLTHTSPSHPASHTPHPHTLPHTHLTRTPCLTYVSHPHTLPHTHLTLTSCLTQPTLTPSQPLPCTSHPHIPDPEPLALIPPLPPTPTCKCNVLAERSMLSTHSELTVSANEYTVLLCMFLQTSWQPHCHFPAPITSS